MAQRKAPILPIPDRFQTAVVEAMRGKALQHQDELTMLLQWVDQIDPPVDLRVIVEIGTHQGGTLACWAELASDLVVAIDLPVGQGGPAEWGGLPEDATIARNLAFSQRYPHVQTILANSHERSTVEKLEEILSGRPIDLLFIDGDHTWAGVSTDYAVYSPLVRNGGVIAFHDVNATIQEKQKNFAVSDFFRMLLPPRFVFSVNADWGGIGAVIR